MSSGHDLRLNNCLRPDHAALLDIVERFGHAALMKVGLGGCEIGAFRWGDDADVDGPPAGLRHEGVEDLVIVDEEVNVQPEGVSEDDLGELERTAANAPVLGGLRDGGLAY